MCGIAAVISRQDAVEERLIKAWHCQRHRGPDDHGVFVEKVGDWFVGLGHQRLSILDLSSAGRQPFHLEGHSDWIVYNGEVYNYIEIRKELESLGWRFNTGTDTEVLLAALRQWGIENTVTRCNGMWAFAWLDRNNGRLTICRDRLGVKPLYICQRNGELLIASEIKAVLAMAGCRFKLDEQVVGEYLLQSLLNTSERTFFEGVVALPAAHYAVINLLTDRVDVTPVRFWSIPNNSAINNPGEEQLSCHIRELFLDAVRLRLRSDVQLGVLLSGGVDSSAIAAAMQHILGKGAEMNLLSAVSDDPRYDESPFIDIMGRFLQRPVQKVRLDFDPEDAFALLNEVCWYNDVPVGSFSNVAHYLLMKRAKEMGITVILSGQGADELLCGYKKYVGFYLQELVARGRPATAFFTAWDFWRNGTVINQFTLSEAKRYLPQMFKPREIDVHGERLRYYQTVHLGIPRSGSVVDRQLLDLERFSVPVLVHYEDRMSMAWSREIRVPFLDYRLVEGLAPLGVEFKLHKGWTKYIFRKAMEPLLPKTITWRKDKQGFVNPQSEWLKKQLRPKVLEVFTQESLISTMGFVDIAKLQKKYEHYCDQPPKTGSISFKDIFNPLALELWLRRFREFIE